MNKTVLNRSATRGSLCLVLCAVLALACSDDTVSTYDTGTPDAGKGDAGQQDRGQNDTGKTDGKPQPDQGKDLKPPVDTQPPTPDSSPPGPFTCASDCSEYVIDRFIIPATSGAALQYSLEHKGKKYNALGNIIALIMQQAPALELQVSVDNDICAGKTINLLRVKATSLVSEPAVKGQWWIGMPFACCTKTICVDSTVKSQCEAGAKMKCFGGTGKFQVDKTKPGNMYVAGAIKGGALALSSATLTLRLSLSGGGGMDVPLKVATIKGNVVKANITGGVLTGGVEQTDVATKLVPGLAQIINTLYIKTKDKKTKDLFKQLFDTNADGQITSSEVANNPLMKTFLAGDVDLDGDGKNEVSMGIAFTAVRAAINTN